MSSKTRIINWLLPGLPELIGILIFTSVLGMGPRMINMDGDLGRHLTVGRYILTSKTIPVQDLFSFTRVGDPLTPHEWLAEVAFALADRWMGLNGVILLTGGILGVTFFLISRKLFSYHLPVWVLIGLILWAAGLSSIHWLARPHVFTFLFLVLWIDGLDQLERGNWKWSYFLWLLMLIWVNTHGAFLYGMAITTLTIVTELIQYIQQPQSARLENRKSVQRWLAFGVGMLLVSLINPAGIHLWGTAFEFLTSHYLVSHTVEYMPPSLNQPVTWLFLLSLAGGAGLLFSKKVNKRTKDVLTFVLFSLMGLSSARNIPIFALVCFPMIGLWLQDLLSDTQLDRQSQKSEFSIRLLMSDLKPGLWSLVVVTLSVLLLRNGVKLDYTRTGNVYLEPQFPVRAADWMKDNPIEGNGFNYFQWGGYLLYRFWPGQKVFIDGQTDFYGEQLTREYETIINGENGWDALLDRYNVHWILIPLDSPLGEKLVYDQHWKLLYHDSSSVVYVKRS